MEEIEGVFGKDVLRNSDLALVGFVIFREQLLDCFVSFFITSEPSEATCDVFLDRLESKLGGQFTRQSLALIG